MFLLYYSSSTAATEEEPYREMFTHIFRGGIFLGVLFSFLFIFVKPGHRFASP